MYIYKSPIIPLLQIAHGIYIPYLTILCIYKQQVLKYSTPHMQPNTKKGLLQVHNPIVILHGSSATGAPPLDCPSCGAFSAAVTAWSLQWLVL